MPTQVQIALVNLESAERELVAAEFAVVRAEQSFAETHCMNGFLRMVHADNELTFWSRMVSRTERELAKAQHEATPMGVAA